MATNELIRVELTVKHNKHACEFVYLKKSSAVEGAGGGKFGSAVGGGGGNSVTAGYEAVYHKYLCSTNGGFGAAGLHLRRMNERNYFCIEYLPENAAIAISSGGYLRSETNANYAKGFRMYDAASGEELFLKDMYGADKKNENKCYDVIFKANDYEGWVAEKWGKEVADRSFSYLNCDVDEPTVFSMKIINNNAK